MLRNPCRGCVGGLTQINDAWADRTYDRAHDEYCKQRVHSLIPGRPGGHWGVKLALTDPRFGGVVNVGGPVHEAFGQRWISELPRGLRATIAKAAKLDPSDAPHFDGALAQLSLVTQGVLRSGSQSSPLLSTNGDKDTIVPITDLKILTDYSIAQDRLIFGRDRHVAGGHRALHVALATERLARHLA